MIAKLNESVHNHIVLRELVISAKRIVKAWQIWRIDCAYRACGRELDVYAAADAEMKWYRNGLQVAQARTERSRINLMLRRADLRMSMNKLGG
jgi:hypothetical protein